MTTPSADSSPRSTGAYEWLAEAVLDGRYRPGDPLKPQHLATQLGVSLSVVREALTRLVGEGMAERLPNRGFVVPPIDQHRLAEVVEARTAVEPNMIRLSVSRGDVAWEARVRAAEHVLLRTPLQDGHEGDGISERRISRAWSDAHHDFHRALLSACGNSVLLDTFERLWTASELARRWSAPRTPGRDADGEHAELARLAIERRADEAADALAAHLRLTASGLGGRA